MSMRLTRAQRGLAILLGAVLACAALRLLIGSGGFGWPADAVVRYRVNAALGAAAVGSALAIAGLFLQVLLRNPLASPFVLGLSSGAGFGYMVALFLAWRFGIELQGGLGIGGPVLAATVGSLATLAIVWRLGARGGTADPLALVLAGVVLSAIAGAGTTAVQSLVPAGLRGDFLAWMMGRIPESPPAGLLVLVIVLAVTATAIGAALGRALDVASLSDDEAASVGLSLARLRIVLFGFAGLLAAGTVTLAGPIAFVGLIAPHAARMLLGPRHGTLAIGSSLAGAGLLLLADTVRQSVDLGAGRLPVGVVTAIVGGPLFLVLLRRGPFVQWEGGRGA
ncbi:MAG: iron ABC transporter permease [Phycisphaerae bacterium]|nr:iron ABC transporter permease [Phycisphaerae bacterium]